MGNQFTNNYPNAYTIFPSMIDDIDAQSNLFYGGLNTALENIENELGINPSGDAATVASAIKRRKAKYYDVAVGTDADKFQFTNIQDAVEHVEALGGGSIFVSKGTYNIDYMIYITGDVYIFGDPNKTNLVKADNNYLPILRLNNSTKQVIIEDIRFNGNKASYTTGAGVVEVQGGMRTIINRCSIMNGTSHGLHALSPLELNVYNCYISSNVQHGVYLDSSNSVCLFFTNNIFSNGGSGFFWQQDYGSFINLMMNSFDLNTDLGIELDGVGEYLVAMYNIFHGSGEGAMNYPTVIRGYGNIYR